MCAPDVDTKTEQPRAYARCSAPPFWEAKGLQRGRKLQTLTFRDKRPLRHECIDVCHEASDEHSKPRANGRCFSQCFWRSVRVAGLTMRDRLARSLLLARNTGAALGVRTGVFKPCRCVYPQCDEITTCLRDKVAELTDTCKTATEVGMKRLPRVSEGTGARKRIAR